MRWRRVERQLDTLGVKQAQERSQTAWTIQRRINIDVNRLTCGDSKTVQVHVGVGIDFLRAHDGARTEGTQLDGLHDRIIGVVGGCSWSLDD